MAAFAVVHDWPEPKRPGVHVAALVRYPYKIFYRILDDRVKILHIRHTSRPVWEQER